MNQQPKLVEIHQPDFMLENTRAIEAARLILSATQNAEISPTEAELRCYVQDVLEGRVHYILMLQETTVAAARVRHNAPRGDTFIEALAVRPEAQVNGYGYELVGHIARRAIQYANVRVAAYAENQTEEIFTSLGFQKRRRYMSGRPEDVKRMASELAIKNQRE